jgi:hypothetical protein
MRNIVILHKLVSDLMQIYLQYHLNAEYIIVCCHVTCLSALRMFNVSLDVVSCTCLILTHIFFY